MKSSGMCRGYWTDVSNLERELLGLMDQKGLDPAKLPTNGQLREMGANQLCNAIEYHGGFSSVAKLLRLTLASPWSPGHFLLYKIASG